MIAPGYPRFELTEEGDTDQLGMGRVWINGEQFVAGVPEGVWNYRVGGYNPLAHWLEDRKGRSLGDSDLDYIEQFVTVLDETIDSFDALDDVLDLPGRADPADDLIM